jgi:phosphatidate cytidylyltransferase
MKQLQEQYASTESSSLVKRTFTGIILVIVISLAVVSGSGSFLFLIVTVHQLGMLEYQKLIRHAGFSLQKITGQLFGILLIVACWLVVRQTSSHFILLLFPSLLTFIFFIELFRNTPAPFQNIALTILGLAWISLPLSIFLCIGFLPLENGQYHPSLILGYFLILWFGDSGAYFIGKISGKHPLFKRISPKKTWEGSIGGLGAALLAAYLNFILFNGIQFHQWLILGLIINITGTFGDFAKSMLKRSMGVKDSGKILPGHGGILDRFDSLMGSAPFAFTYLFVYA